MRISSSNLLECDCGDNLLIIPCDGTVKHRYYLKMNDSTYFCSKNCKFYASF